MSNSVLPIEAAQDALNGIQPMASTNDLSPPTTLITEPQPPVLISVQEVLLGTAAALSPRPHYARRAMYLENARMAREMERL